MSVIDVCNCFFQHLLMQGAIDLCVFSTRLRVHDLNPSPFETQMVYPPPLQEHQRIAVRDLGGLGSAPKSLLNILADCPKPFDSRDLR